ncbi:MAG: hypothetical protein E5Y34_06625 [Mesorhizobium sp.]|uniref:hypothetical protein n=1 Tax=Mesorhizobium sp. TaxID=1871066 RepID=UPI0011F69E00|nr:hypothetical protein [Mesorhizobium sp.]TIN02696.1 MAG: hypothetical protein E5Y34_06625 [Mesorhizobium sp.]
MKILKEEAARLFPNVAQYDQKLYTRLAAIGLVARKRPGRSYDQLEPREIAAFLLARLSADYLDEALAVMGAIHDMPGKIDGVPAHWIECSALAAAGNHTFLDWSAALVSDFMGGRADQDQGLGNCEIRLSVPLPTVRIGLAASRWQADMAWAAFEGRFARSPEYEDDGDYLSDLAAIEATQPKSLRMTAIVSERSIDLATVRAFARAFK